MKLVTDGKFWAIKRGWLRPKYFFIASEHIDGDRKQMLCRWEDAPGGSWMDKETAEKWFRRLTA